MSLQPLKHVLGIGLLLLCGWTANIVPSAWGQEQSARKTKSKITPAYPELARRMRISGIVKVQVTVAPNGAVRNAKLMGGHPVLANAAMDVVMKWRYEAAKDETVENLEFRFSPDE